MPVRVLISSDLDDAALDDIRTVSASVVVRRAATLADAVALAGDAEVVFAGLWSEGLWKAAPRLRWVQSSAAGVERFLTDTFAASSVILTSARGVYADPIADHVMAFVLSFARGFNMLVRSQIVHRWDSWWGVRPDPDRIGGDPEAGGGRAGVLSRVQRTSGRLVRTFMEAAGRGSARGRAQECSWAPDELTGKTLGLVGLGAVGSEVARRAKAFGLRVVATRRRPELACMYADDVRGPDELPWLLRESDFVALCAPLTRATRGLVGEDELRLMKPTAYLINVARGELVDEQGLCSALATGVIAGAGLDVFEQEPLPKRSPLWDLPNVMITPHNAGQSRRSQERVNALFRENLERYLDGRPLANVVDKPAGY